MLVRRPEARGDQERADFVAVQGSGVRLVVQAGMANVPGQGMIEEFLLDGVPVEPFLVRWQEIAWVVSLPIRRPRTVLGRLGRRTVPAGRHGLPPGGLPWGLAGSVVPVRLPGAGCSGGSSHAAVLWPWPCHACPSPRPVAQRTPSRHQRGRVMTGKLTVMLPQRGEPVLGRPPGRVGRVHRDHVQPGVISHLGEAVPESPGRDA